jgi:hypothetical protein
MALKVVRRTRQKLTTSDFILITSFLFFDYYGQRLFLALDSIAVILNHKNEELKYFVYTLPGLFFWLPSFFLWSSNVLQSGCPAVEETGEDGAVTPRRPVTRMTFLRLLSAPVETGQGKLPVDAFPGSRGTDFLDKAILASW